MPKQVDSTVTRRTILKVTRLPTSVIESVESPRLAFRATCLGNFGVALLVGQFALDFAMPAAAQIEPRLAGEAVVDTLLSQPFVNLAFYKLPDLLQLGAVLFVIGIW